MIPTNGSSFGRAGGRLRRYPGGTENASIFATVRGSIPNRRAASRRLIPSTYTARRTCPYSSTPFIPSPTSAAPRQMQAIAAGFLLRRNRTTRPLLRHFLSGAYNKPRSQGKRDARPLYKGLRNNVPGRVCRLLCYYDAYGRIGA